MNYDINMNAGFSSIDNSMVFDFLRYESLGINVWKHIDNNYSSNKFYKSSRLLKIGEPIYNGTIFYEAGVTSFFQDNGIKDITTLMPEFILEINRLRAIDRKLWSDHGVVIFDDKGDKNTQKYIKHLMGQAKIKKKDLPVALFQLSLYKDKKLIYGAGLDYNKKSIKIEAPALKSEKSKIITTTANQTIEDLLTSPKVFKGDSELIIDLKPGGIKRLTRTGNTIYIKEFTFNEPMGGRILINKKRE